MLGHMNPRGDTVKIRIVVRACPFCEGRRGDQDGDGAFGEGIHLRLRQRWRIVWEHDADAATVPKVTPAMPKVGGELFAAPRRLCEEEHTSDGGGEGMCQGRQLAEQQGGRCWAAVAEGEWAERRHVMSPP